jgi:putative flippase GtrA
MRLRIYEMGISYHGRSYAEGKKIGVRDGFRALYCIFRYNAHRAPLPVQFLIYLFIGGTAALVNLACFLVFNAWGANLFASVVGAFFIAAAVNYVLSIVFLFRHKARWSTSMELVMFALVVLTACGLDYAFTAGFMAMGLSAGWAKAFSSMVNLAVNFAGRRFLVFPEPSSGSWK